MRDWLTKILLGSALQKLDQVITTQAAIGKRLDLIEKGEKENMQAFEDLKAEVSGMRTDLDAFEAAVAAKLDGISDVKEADVQAVVDQVKAQRADVQAKTAALQTPPVEPQA